MSPSGACSGQKVRDRESTYFGICLPAPWHFPLCLLLCLLLSFPLFIFLPPPSSPSLLFHCVCHGPPRPVMLSSPVTRTVSLGLTCVCLLPRPFVSPLLLTPLLNFSRSHVFPRSSFIPSSHGAICLTFASYFNYFQTFHLWMSPSLLRSPTLSLCSSFFLIISSPHLNFSSPFCFSILVPVSLFPCSLGCLSSY